jgi:FixJ family two-component response regulator
MVVDDETDILEKVKVSLENDEFEVVTASDSREALELMTDNEEEKYGLILIDTPLPGTKKSAFFSMKPKSKMHIDVSKTEDFLQKPFTEEQLLDFVKRKIDST